jgi:hypothetical protein
MADEPEKIELSKVQVHALMDMRDALNKFGAKINERYTKLDRSFWLKCKAEVKLYKNKDGKEELYLYITDEKGVPYVCIPFIDIERHSEWHTQI